MSKEKEFNLPFGVIKFDSQFVQYNELYVEYDTEAYVTAVNFLEYIKQKCTDMESLVNHCESELLIQLKPYIDKVVNKLIGEGFYDINTSHFIEKFYQNKYYRFNDNFDEIADKFYEITLKKEQLNEYRTARRKNRGRIIGGGFGVGGAVEGMAMAGAANLAIGAVHGTFNLIGSAISSIKIHGQLKELYNSESLESALFNAVYWSVFNIHHAFRDAYQYFKNEPYGRLPTKDEKERSSRLVDNLKSNRIPSDKIANILCEAISSNPYNKDTYIYALDKYMDCDASITQFTDFLSVDVEGFKKDQLNKVYNESKDYSSETECLELYNKLQQLATNLAIKSKHKALEIVEQDLKRFNEEAKKVAGCLYETREEADAARKELEWIQPALKLLDHDHCNEDAVISLINEITLKAISKNAKEILTQLENTRIELDKKFRTVNNRLLATREEAEIARYEINWWSQKQEVLESNSLQNLLSLYKEAKVKNFTSVFSKENLLAITEKAKKLELEQRTFKGVVFDSINDANQAKSNFEFIEKRRQSIDFDNEEKVIEWIDFLNKEQLSKNELNDKILSQYIEEARKKATELDRQARTFLDVEISTRENVELAKIEHSNIEKWFKSIDSPDEKFLIELKNKISNETKTEIKIHWLEMIDELLDEIDTFERTVDNVVYKTREDAYNIRNKEKIELATVYQEIKDRGFFKSLFLYSLGIFSSLILIGWLQGIGLGIVAFMYLGFFVQRSKQKAAWEELNQPILNEATRSNAISKNSLSIFRVFKLIVWGFIIFVIGSIVFGIIGTTDNSSTQNQVSQVVLNQQKQSEVKQVADVALPEKTEQTTITLADSQKNISTSVDKQAAIVALPEKTEQTITTLADPQKNVSPFDDKQAAITADTEILQPVETPLVAEPQQVAVVTPPESAQATSSEKEELARYKAKEALDEANKQINIVWNAPAKEIRKAILPEQKKWLKQREGNCGLKASTEEPNNSVVQEAIKFNCMATMTNERAEVLKQKIANLQSTNSL